MEKKYNYLFGPVPSRRFGRSLGVDLTPYKTCSLDCIFCQLGRTTEKTVERKEYVPTDIVLSELKDWLNKDGEADYITLSGSGEPTLHSRFGEVLEFIRSNSKIPAVLLSNGTMLNLPEVRDAAACANVVKCSLSAWNQVSCEWVNRPHPQLRFDHLIKGQKDFRAQFKGQLWIEVFLIAGTNSTPTNVRKIADLAKGIGPDRIHLNTAVRPPVRGLCHGPFRKTHGSPDRFVSPVRRNYRGVQGQAFKPCPGEPGNDLIHATAAAVYRGSNCGCFRYASK